MSPSERYAVADGMYRDHAKMCVWCGPPDATRRTHNRNCGPGRQLYAAWLTAWRARVDALTDRWSR